MVIYSGERVPSLVPGEDDVVLKREPVKVTLDPKGESLMPASRISLAKVYTIEHNIPTFVVGKVSTRDVERIKQATIEVQGFFATVDNSLPEVGEEDEEDDED
jgi:hypothetical protein